MEEKVNALTLRAVSFGENDSILTLFSLENGVITAKIRGVKKAGAKLKFVAQPFSFSEIILTKKGEYKTVIGASLLDGFYPLRLDIVKTYCASAVLEFIKIFGTENEESAELFSETVNALKVLSYGDDNPKVLLIDFLIKALKTSGYALNFSGCAVCGNEIEGKTFFDFSIGAGVCSECADVNSKEIYHETFDTLKRIAEGERDSFDELFLNRALKLINFYVNIKTDETIKSVKELLEL